MNVEALRGETDTDSGSEPIERASVAGPPVLLLTRDDPSTVRGGVETFCDQLRQVCPGSELVSYGGASGVRRGFKEARDARAIVPRVRDVIAACGLRAVVANGAGASALPHDLGVPVVTVYHGTYAGYGAVESQHWPLKGLWTTHVGAALERRAGRRADQVVAVSESVAEQARRAYGVTARVIHNAAPTESPRSMRHLGVAQGPRLLFVGRPTWAKGFDLLEAVARQRPDWTFYIVGGDGTSDLPNLVWLGVCEPQEVRSLYAQADVTLLPSRYEGCSYAPLEAMRAGCPVVATAVGLFSAPGPQPFGAIVPSGDAEALEHSIDDVLSRPVAPRAWVDRHHSAEQFSASWSSCLWECVA